MQHRLINGFGRPFLVLAFGLFLSTAAPATAQPQIALPDCHVLGIGIDVYVREANVPNLSGCVRDATNLVERMKDQAGKLFAKVTPHLLTNDTATGANVDTNMKQLGAESKPGDWVVLILSSHGGIDPKTNRWSGVLQDAKDLTDTAILSWTNDMAAKGRKVWIIVDACQAGQIRVNGFELLERFTDPKAGGIIFMLATVPSQESQALGKFSTYAEAANEGLLGDADYDRDGNITLKELRHYAYRRAYELNRQYQKPLQDGECSYSVSIAETQVVAKSLMDTILQLDTDLTTADKRDTQRTGSYCKTYEVKLDQGVDYIIDLKSSAFDAYLRLEDSTGKQIAFNDDVGGGNRDSRIVYTPQRSGSFRVIATTYTNNATGAFTLKVRHKLNLAKKASQPK